MNNHHTNKSHSGYFYLLKPDCEKGFNAVSSNRKKKAKSDMSIIFDISLRNLNMNVIKGGKRTLSVASLRATVRGASLMKRWGYSAGVLLLRRLHLKRGGCAALCPLLTTLEPYLASPLNSPSYILFIKSFHILLCHFTVPLYILLLSEV